MSGQTGLEIMDLLRPEGLKVMVVEGDSSHLLTMEELLRQCGYDVVTFTDVAEAIVYGMGKRNRVDIVISDVFLPNEDGLLVLKTIALQLEIPAIMTSGSGETSLVMKYIANGASDFLIKPVRINVLRNVWQHVFRRRMGTHANFGTRSDLDIIVSEGLMRSSTANSAPAQESNETVEDIRGLKKSRLQWTEQLHRQFVSAVNELGIEKAIPKKIVEIMNVRQLTRGHVASHLQKYRLHLKKMSSPGEQKGGPSQLKEWQVFSENDFASANLRPEELLGEEKMGQDENSTCSGLLAGDDLCFSELMEEFNEATNYRSQAEGFWFRG